MELGYATRLTHRPPAGEALASVPTTLQPVLEAQTQVLARRQWGHLTAQLHQEPACVGPVQVHSVPAVELVVQLAGALQLCLANGGRQRRYLTTPGTLFLTPADRPAYEVTWLNVAPEPVRTLHLYLTPALIASTAVELELDATRVELRDDSGLHDPLLYQLGIALAQELTVAAPQQLYGETITQLLAVQLLRQYNVQAVAPRERRGQLSPAQLRRLRDYVRDHLDGPIPLADLAAVACLSPYHFCRLFKRTTGQSPNQFVIGQRMEQARQLLRRGELSSTQVALAVGYQNPSHFAQLFQRHTGHAPLSDRAAARAKSAR